MAILEERLRTRQVGVASSLPAVIIRRVFRAGRARYRLSPHPKIDVRLMFLSSTRDRFLLALQYSDYRDLWVATTCSGAAAWALIVARGWLAYEITENSVWVGIITFAAMAPRVFSTPIVGYLADRFDRKTLLQWIFALNLVHNVILSFLVMNDMAGTWTLMVLALFNGTLRASQMTVASALIPNLVPRQHLLNAMALNQATQQGSRMVGALAILPLMGFVSIDMAFWLCSAFYAVGLLAVGRVGIKSTGKLDESQGFWFNMVAGFKYVYSRPQILAMVLLVLAHCALTMSYESILPVISDEKLGAGSVGVSYLWQGWAPAPWWRPSSWPVYAARSTVAAYSCCTD